MTLRKASLLLFVLAFTAAAQADPVSMKLTGASNATYGSLNVSGFEMATNLAPPSHSGQSQQVSTSGPTIPAPEPATLALFGTGLIGVATLVRFRIRRAAEFDKK
jgi:hypothetical protein